MRYRLLWGAAMFGVAVHLAGLAWDVWLHSNDATLAAREGVFTLSNPGHALVVAGVTITAIALAAALVLWTGEHAPRRVAFGARLAALPVLGLAAASAVWVTTQAETESHSHQQQHAGAAAHNTPTQAQPAVAAIDNHPHAAGGEAAPGAHSASPMSSEDHAAHNEVKVSPDQLQAAALLVTKSNETAAKYADVRTALRDGYVQVTQDLEGIAAHFHHAAYASDGKLMDAERPETLLYSKRLDGTWRLVGLMFSSEKPSDTPPSFFGALDVWHRHENLCFTPGAVTVTANATACRGVFVPVTAWNLHVWTAPGATTGVFAHDFPPISPGAFPPAVRTAAVELQVRAQ